MTWNMILCALPSSFCQLNKLTSLDLSDSYILGLPDGISCLTSLEHLNLTNTALCVEAFYQLKTMTQLQSLLFSSLARVQLIQCLTFFSAFVRLKQLWIKQPRMGWNAMSKWHIDELTAVLQQAFDCTTEQEGPRVDHTGFRFGNFP